MRIVKNGDVHVSAPIGMPKKEVERFIEEHREWIAEAKDEGTGRRCPAATESPDRADGGEPLQGDGREAVSSPLQGDDFTLGCLQCQGQVHLLLCLSATVAGMVCRACGGS